MCLEGESIGTQGKANAKSINNGYGQFVVMRASFGPLTVSTLVETGET